ncbi:MAG: transcriptional regulator, TetR family [Frankiales bacterium]|nr:transcriptional regulator, TetR family [Frankiales bacterium]
MHTTDRRPVAGRPRGETRQRILDTALALFAEHGYAGTSIRDIADELGVTKAAVHYHFAAKEQIVLALLEPMLAQFAEVVERQAQAPTGPRDLLLGVREVLVESGPLLSVLASDPSVAGPGAGLHAEVHALAARTAEVLAGPGASSARLLRAHCALGGFYAGWDTSFRGLTGTAAGVVDDDELEVVLDAALAALGPPAT